MKNITSITISKNTKSILDELGTVSSTYDSLIKELVEHVKFCKFSEVKK